MKRVEPYTTKIEAVDCDFEEIKLEPSHEITLEDVTRWGLTTGKVIGKGVWFVACIPLGVLAHIGKAITSPSSAPTAPRYDLPTIPKPRRSITIEREWREKIKIEDA